MSKIPFGFILVVPVCREPGRRAVPVARTKSPRVGIVRRSEFSSIPIGGRIGSIQDVSILQNGILTKVLPLPSSAFRVSYPVLLAFLS